jgi:hypothetical protein
MKAATPYSTLKLLHQAMLMAQVIFGGVIFYLLYSKTVVPPMPEEDKKLQVIALISTAGSIFSGLGMFKKKIASIKEQPLSSITEKLFHYKLACLLLWSLIEIPAFFLILCFFLTGNYAFLALAAVLIMYFAMQAPSKTKVAQHLDISSSELDGL